MLEASALECERGGGVLFRELSLALHAGDILRISGVNGSGKTSLLRILCGLLTPDAGEVRWKGRPIRSLREDYSRELVYLGHAPAVKDDLTAVENLRYACAFAGIGPAGVESAIERFGVPLDAPVKRLSQGQKRRAALARLVISSAIPLWLLDEPLAALDADAAALVEDLVRAHAAGGGAVVFTTHQDTKVAATRVIALHA